MRKCKCKNIVTVFILMHTSKEQQKAQFGHILIIKSSTYLHLCYFVILIIKNGTTLD